MYYLCIELIQKLMKSYIEINKALYVRPSLAQIKELFQPLGWELVVENNNDFPYETKTAYLFHKVPNAILSSHIAKFLATWLYDFHFSKVEDKKVIIIDF